MGLLVLSLVAACAAAGEAPQQLSARERADVVARSTETSLRIDAKSVTTARAPASTSLPTTSSPPPSPSTTGTTGTTARVIDAAAVAQARSDLAAAHAREADARSRVEEAERTFTTLEVTAASTKRWESETALLRERLAHYQALVEVMHVEDRIALLTLGAAAPSPRTILEQARVAVEEAKLTERVAAFELREAEFELQRAQAYATPEAVEAARRAHEAASAAHDAATAALEAAEGELARLG